MNSDPMLDAAPSVTSSVHAPAQNGGPGLQTDAYAVLTRALAMARSGVPPQAFNEGLMGPGSSLHERYISGSHVPGDLDDLTRRLARLAAGRTTISVVSDDPIMREGLDTVLNRHGVLTWPSTVETSLTPVRGAWDYVLLWLPSRAGIDPFSSIAHIPRLASSDVPVVTVYPGMITKLCRLRLAEAGARYAIPQWWLSQSVEKISELFARAELPAAFHLETPLALRQELGLRLSGELEPLLSAAMLIPERVWRDRNAPAATLQRTEVTRLRRLALNAGLPPPDDRYSAVTRKAPSSPAWRDVHTMVRGIFNFRA